MKRIIIHKMSSFLANVFVWCSNIRTIGKAPGEISDSVGFPIFGSGLLAPRQNGFFNRVESCSGRQGSEHLIKLPVENDSPHEL